MGRLTPLDWIVFAAYLLGTVMIGSWFTKRQTSTKEFFVGGQRMHWIPVALSIMAGMISGISFIGHPARVYQYDSAMIAWPFATALMTPIVIFVLLPFYRRLNVVSAYEYLEKRFNVNVRLLASALFVGKRLLWISLVAIAPSLVLKTCLDIPVEYCILIIGLVATLYTGLGGITGVIWADAFQLVILLTGQILMIIFIVSRLDGGIAEIWQVGYENNKALPTFDFDLSRLTFWSTLIAGSFIVLSDMGADQLVVQRLMTTPDERTARKSLVLNAAMKFVSFGFVIFIGLALFAFYTRFPELLKLDLSNKETYNQIVPYFVITQLPTGISGLIIAAIFAAAISSFDAGLNCLVTVFTVDWCERLGKSKRSDRYYLILAKVLTFVMGGAITFLAMVIYWIGLENLIDRSNEFLGFFGGVLLGIYLLGVLTRRAKPLPTVLGALFSMLVVLLFILYQSRTGTKMLHSTTYGMFSCLITMLIGYFGSFLGRPLPYEKVRDYTMIKLNRAENRNDASLS